jgi:omega-6 fatty acid desaturase (delta-12 desaturase)
MEHPRDAAIPLLELPPRWSGTPALSDPHATVVLTLPTTLQATSSLEGVSDHADPALRRSDFVLRPFLQRSNAIGAWQVLNTLVPFSLLWLAALWCLEHQPVLLLPVLAVQVLFLARCFSLMHDCGHETLFRNHQANRWVGFLLGVVAGIPQLPWSRGHAFHHRHNGDWQKYQGPSALISTEAFAQLSPGRKRLYRWLRHPLMLFPGGFFYLVIKPRLALVLGLRDLIPWMISELQRTPRADLHTLFAAHRSRHWHSPSEGMDLIWNNIAVLVLWLLMGSQLGIGRFWSLYTPLMTCSAAVFICVFFVQHNFPGSYAHRTEGWNPMAGVIKGTSNLELPALLNWFTADIGCHAIHHLCEAIPNYRLRACQERNAALLQGVRSLRLADIHGCFAFILWDPIAARLTTIAAQPAAPECFAAQIARHETPGAASGL